MFYRTVKKFLSSQLFPPIALLLSSLAVLLTIRPLTPVFAPPLEIASQAAQGDETYAAGGSLYYSGSDYLEDGKVKGRFYYTIKDGCCQFVLLPADQAPLSPEFRISPFGGALLKLDASYLQKLTDNLSDSLGWRETGRGALQTITSPYLYSTVHCRSPRRALLLSLLSACIGFSALDILRALLLSSHTLSLLHLPLSGVKYTEKPGEIPLLPPLIRISGFLMTPNYLVNARDDYSAPLPLSSIIWAYGGDSRRAMLRKAAKRQCLRIVTKDGRGHRFIRNGEEDISLLLDALSTFRPEILIGYGKEQKKTAWGRLREPKY